MMSDVEQRIGQIQRGRTPKGYQRTKLGIIPVDWTVCEIGTCLERVSYPVEVQPNELYDQIGIRSHGKGPFYKEPVNGASLGNKAVFWVVPDCFIVNIVFAWEQAIGKTTQKEVGMIASHRFPMYRPLDNKVDVDYLIAFFLSKRGTDILEAASPGGAGRNKTLGQERFMKSKIVLPPIAEQKRIVDILSTQDRIIELLEKKVEQLQLLKKSYMQKMFPQPDSDEPEIRFPGFAGPWRQRKLRDIVKRITRKNQHLETKLPLTISAQHGLIDQNEFFDKKVASEDVSGYYLIKNGEFAYNKSTSLDAPWGAIKRLEKYEMGVLSTLYIVFSIQNEEEIDSDYLVTYYDTNLWHKGIRAVAAEGARNHGLLNISSDDFFEMTLPVPESIEEQERIGQLFQNLGNLISLHQQKRDEEVRKKQALMQLLLTGIVRVNA